MNTSLISDVSLTHPLSSSTVNPIQFNYFINPKLDENNFLLWKSQVLPVIRGYGFLSFLDGTPPSTSIDSSSDA
jgi:hypothetical protein